MPLILYLNRYHFLFYKDGWTMDDLIYEWKAEEPVQIVDNLNLPRFKLEHYDTDHCNTLTNTGEYQKSVFST